MFNIKILIKFLIIYCLYTFIGKVVYKNSYYVNCSNITLHYFSEYRAYWVNFFSKLKYEPTDNSRKCNLKWYKTVKK
jgi:hypothetical protein